MSDTNKNSAKLEEPKKEINHVGNIIGGLVGLTVIVVIGVYAYTYFYPIELDIAKNKDLREPLIEGGMFNIGE